MILRWRERVILPQPAVRSNPPRPLLYRQSLHLSKKREKCDKNWVESYAEAKKLADSNGFASIKSTSSVGVGGWLSRARRVIEDNDSGAFDPNKSTSAWTAERIDLARPLVEKFENRNKGSGSGNCSRSRSRSRGRDKSASRSNKDGGTKIDWANVDVTKYSVDRDKQCKNPANQDLFQQLVNMGDYRVRVVGVARKNTGHFFTGARLIKIVKCLLLVSL